MNELLVLLEEKKHMLQEAAQQIKGMERMVTKTRKRLLSGKYEKGCLISETKNGRYSYYFHREDGQRIYLRKKKDAKVISCLAQKEYNEKLTRWIEQKLEALEQLERLCPELYVREVYDGLHPARKELVDPIFITDDEYAKRWEEEHYVTNSFEKPGNLEDALTKKGEAVRSKSEKIIADMLYDNHVPYRYEPECILDDGRRVFPDFVVLNKRTRKEFLWEHLGMMDNPEYSEHNILKLRHYEQNGYLLGTNLIMTNETAAMQLSTKTVQMYIDSLLV